MSQRTFNKVAVIGLGYIGLPTAAVLAAEGIEVLGIDINACVVDSINQGKAHIAEPELDDLLYKVVRQGYLRASLEIEAADAFVIAVPTPFKDTYQADLGFIEAAVKRIASVLKKQDLVILESTSPVGTTEKMAQWFRQLRPDLQFPSVESSFSEVHMAYCPERVLPGQIVKELINNDRIIGGITENCTVKAQNLYKAFAKGCLLATKVRTAEMCKLAENTFRDVNIAYANELSIICDKLDINVWELIELANHHPRVNILSPGPGVGGHCIAVDPWFIISQNPKEALLIKAAREVNNSKPKWVLSQVNKAVNQWLLANPDKTENEITITCFGLTFKANVEDLRESPAAKIVHQLLKDSVCKIRVVEPHIQQLPKDLAGKTVLNTLNQAISSTNIAVILVDHDLFKSSLYQLPKECIIVDTRGLLNQLTKKAIQSLEILDVV